MSKSTRILFTSVFCLLVSPAISYGKNCAKDYHKKDVCEGDHIALSSGGAYKVESVDKSELTLTDLLSGKRKSLVISEYSVHPSVPEATHAVSKNIKWPLHEGTNFTVKVGDIVQGPGNQVIKIKHLFLDNESKEATYVAEILGSRKGGEKGKLTWGHQSDVTPEGCYPVFKKTFCSNAERKVFRDGMVFLINADGKAETIHADNIQLAEGPVECVDQASGKILTFSEAELNAVDVTSIPLWMTLLAGSLETLEIKRAMACVKQSAIDGTSKIVKRPSLNEQQYVIEGEKLKEVLEAK